MINLKLIAILLTWTLAKPERNCSTNCTDYANDDSACHFGDVPVVCTISLLFDSTVTLISECRGRSDYWFLCRRRITYLAPGIFNGKTTPLRIDLSHNIIATLESDIFIGLTELQYLNFGNNRITTLKADPFKRLTNLLTLNLYDNDIRSINTGTFNGLNKLQSLDLRFNRITNIKAGAFNGLKTLQNLFLKGNEITTLKHDSFVGLDTLRSLDLRYNRIENINAGAFTGLKKLQSLYFKGNEITTLEANSFNGLETLRYLGLSNQNITSLVTKSFNGSNALLYLDLENNKITSIEAGAFNSLKILQNIYLEGNTITTLEANSFFGLETLRSLNLNNQRITTLVANTFNGLNSLRHLKLQYNKITKINNRAFHGLKTLQTLNLKDNKYLHYSRNAFLALVNLKSLSSDDFTLCCLMRDIVEECSPEPDVFSSCDDLLKREVLRYLMLTLGISSLFGNLIVIISRIRKNEFNVQSIFITNLAVSDLLMSVYMIIITGADFYYRGQYAKFANVWKASFLCSFLAGSIATVSSECSVFILMVLSFDRALSIAMPFRPRIFNPKRCKIVLGIAWFVVVTLSILPACNYFSFINIHYFGDNYYGRQGVCLALPLTRSREPGWEYAISIFIAFNFFSFLVIAASYITIYISATVSASAVNRSTRRAEDIRMATKLAMIVLTDFFCWFPIILMGIASEAGTWKLPDEIYVWSATFIIPINSSINPYLYTVAGMCKDMLTSKHNTNTIEMQVVSQGVKNNSSRTQETEEI